MTHKRGLKCDTVLKHRALVLAPALYHPTVEQVENPSLGGGYWEEQPSSLARMSGADLSQIAKSSHSDPVETNKTNSDDFQFVSGLDKSYSSNIRRHVLRRHMAERRANAFGRRKPSLPVGLAPESAPRPHHHAFHDGSELEEEGKLATSEGTTNLKRDVINEILVDEACLTRHRSEHNGSNVRGSNNPGQAFLWARARATAPIYQPNRTSLFYDLFVRQFSAYGQIPSQRDHSLMPQLVKLSSQEEHLPVLRISIRAAAQSFMALSEEIEQSERKGSPTMPGLSKRYNTRLTH